MVDLQLTLSEVLGKSKKLLATEKYLLRLVPYSFQFEILCNYSPVPNCRGGLNLCVGQISSPILLY